MIKNQNYDKCDYFDRNIGLIHRDSSKNINYRDGESINVSIEANDFTSHFQSSIYPYYAVFKVIREQEKTEIFHSALFLNNNIS